MGTGGTVHRDRGGTQSGATQVAQTRFVSEAEWVPILRMRFCARVADGGASVSLARHLCRGRFGTVPTFTSLGRLRTHFPSGPSSRPVPGVQVDARRRRWKSNLREPRPSRVVVVFCRARDRTAPFCRGRRNNACV